MRRLFATLLVALALPAAALDLTGTRSVRLHDNDGAPRVLGTISFTRDGDGWLFTFEPDRRAFGEYFLAMRPFLCLDGEKESYCLFPYDSPRRITPADLTDLEYALMFLRKPRAAVNLDPFNGIYYRLRIGERGIEGKLYEVDMNPIIAPEGKPLPRPIGPADLVEVSPKGHWLPRLTID